MGAVADVSLHLREGENLGIVGKSGSGKTTLGRCLLRVIESTTESVFYCRPDGSEIDISRAPAVIRYRHRKNGVRT